MVIERFYDLLLDFGKDWKVIEVESNLETDEVDIYIDYVGQEKIYDHAPARRWRHLDTMQFKSFINCRLPRIRAADGKVKTLAPPWADKHERHSYLFENKVIETLLATKNQTQTASLMACSFDKVNRIMHLATKRGMERREETKEVYENLSVDEKSFQKGHSYVSVLSHSKTERVLDVVEHRTLKACRELTNTGLTEKQREQVKTITMDMWEAFMTMAREKLPNAANRPRQVSFNQISKRGDR